MKIDDLKQLMNEELTVVDFFATWCGPCKMLGSVIETVERELTNVNFIKIDVDNNEELANHYGVMTIPTLIIFKNREMIDKKIGFIPKEELIAWINTKR